MASGGRGRAKKKPGTADTVPVGGRGSGLTRPAKGAVDMFAGITPRPGNIFGSPILAWTRPDHRRPGTTNV